MSKSSSGLFSGTKGSKNSLPKNKSQINHIFAKRPGHLKNTPKNQKTLIDLINNKSNFKGTDKDGCDWYIKKGKNGSQYWAKVYKGVLSDGGYNKSPKNWDPDTGLCKNPFKKGGKK